MWELKSERESQEMKVTSVLDLFLRSNVSSIMGSQLMHLQVNIIAQTSADIKSMRQMLDIQILCGKQLKVHYHDGRHYNMAEFPTP